MKQCAILLLLFSGIAFAQNSNRASLSPMVAVTHYNLDGEGITGPTMGLRYLSPEFSSSRCSLFGGATLRREGFSFERTESFIYANMSQPYRPQPPIYDNAIPASRFAFGLAFVGFDWRKYFADGDVRPYLGVGAQVVSWSSTGTWTGAIMPTANAGLDVQLSSGFSAFAESEYAFGMPTLFGSRISTLKNLFSFGLGVTFIPRW